MGTQGRLHTGSGPDTLGRDGRVEFNIKVIPTAPQDAGMETFSSFNIRTRTQTRPRNGHVHPKVISGQSSATLGFQRDQGRLPGA